jgi:septum formation topological specificity factor MinE
MMDITITTGTKQLKTFINETADLTDVYRGIQRNYVWGDVSKKGYNTSLIKGTAVGSFVLADIQTCFEKAKMDGNVGDMEFFDGFLKRKFEYISIDGNNRTQFILSEYGKHLKNYRDSSDEIRKVLNNEITINVIKYATKVELHQIAIDINSNTSWNKQETRNAILGSVSDYIRGISDMMEPVSLKIKEINVNRLGDDEMYATFLYYSQISIPNITPGKLTKMYKNNIGLENLQLFEKVLTNWGKVVESISNIKPSNKPNVNKSLACNLFYVLWDLSFKHNYKLNDEMISEFSQKYVDLENDRLKVSMDFDSGTNLWYEINRYSSKMIDKKVKRIIDDFGVEITEYFYKIDSVRNFKVEDKLRKCIETDGIVVRLDGSIEVITPLDSMNGNVVEGDHIEPHSKGGDTEYDNLELLITEDNRKKGNK